MPKKNDSNKPAGKPIDFEQALQELESLVEQLERGDLSLENSLKLFERGITLAQHCQTALTSAEQKVRILTEKQGHSTIEPFKLDDDSATDE